MNELLNTSNDNLIQSAIANVLKPPAGTKKVKINMEFITDTEKIRRNVTLHKNRSISIHMFTPEKI